MTHTKASLQCFNVEDALSIGQNCGMTSQTWFTGVMNAKGMATRSPDLQREISATRPMEILGMDLVDFRGKHALGTVDYFSGFLTYDTLESETTDTVTKLLGSCFRSNNFRRFCDQLDIGHVTSSPYYHQSNGRAERAVATIEQILKKSASDIDIAKALTTYLDTPVSDTLPSPAELFQHRRINTRLSMAMTPAPLTDQQNTHLSAKRSAHLKS